MNDIKYLWLLLIRTDDPAWVREAIVLCWQLDSQHQQLANLGTKVRVQLSYSVEQQ